MVSQAAAAMGVETAEWAASLAEGPEVAEGGNLAAGPRAVDMRGLVGMLVAGLRAVEMGAVVEALMAGTVVDRAMVASMEAWVEVMQAVGKVVVSIPSNPSMQQMYTFRPTNDC